MDQQLRFKICSPDGPSYAPRIRNEQWEQYKPLLRHLHDESYKRADMLEVLRKQGFNPSMGQLNAKMTAWGFKVYGTQTGLQNHGTDITTRQRSSESIVTAVADQMEDDSEPSQSSGRSISSVTLCDSAGQSNTLSNNETASLEHIITEKALELVDSYWPSIWPLDFGLKPDNEAIGVDESFCQSTVAIADFLYAVHCFEQAFDLYYHIFEHHVTRNLDSSISLVRSVVQCAISATTDTQCTYALSIIQPAHSHCVEHGISELAACFGLLLGDVNTEKVVENEPANRLLSDDMREIALLIATDPDTKSASYQKEFLTHQLSKCDRTYATLAHLSLWCQETLSFYRLENQAIGWFHPQPADGPTEAAAFEHDFQVLISGLVIDYLNSPGPSLKKANVECKEKGCLFRWSLSPCTSLIVMAHLLYEPLRLQSQTTTNQYLYDRAQRFASSQSTTALQELRSFAAADSHTRCGVFVDTYVKHFSTTLTFRRFVSGLDCGWDRITAAKRLAQVLQSNQTGLLPHAGLPSARRAVLKNMVSPFGHDPSFTEGRRSIVSDNGSGSMREFERLATQIGTTGSRTPSDTMSIDTRSSWSFNRVTGFPQGLLSGRNSISSRRGDHDEAEEYRRFIKDNNYSQQTLAQYPDTPTQTHATPTERKP